MDTFLTIISGVIVFVISQFVMDFIIKPIKEYKSLKYKVLYTLTLYCNFYTNPYNSNHEEKNIRTKEEYAAVSSEIRKTGAEVAAFLGNVPWYLPLTRKKLNVVMHDLIGISNGLFAGRNLYFLSVENKKLEDDIKKKLRFK